MVREKYTGTYWQYTFESPQRYWFLILVIAGFVLLPLKDIIPNWPNDNYLFWLWLLILLPLIYHWILWREAKKGKTS